MKYNNHCGYCSFIVLNSKNLKAYDEYLQKNYIIDETIHYPNKIRSHLVTMVPMVQFTPKSISKLRFDLHFRCSIVIPSGVVVVERLERSLQFLFSRVERRSSS